MYRENCSLLTDRKVIWGGIFLVAIAVSAVYSLSNSAVNVQGLAQLQEFLLASLHPDLSSGFLRLTARETLTTLAYAVCGTAISITIGLFLGIFTSRVWWLVVFPRSGNYYPFWLGVRLILAIPRAIHEYIWGLFFVSIWGLDPLAAIAAIAIPYGAIVGKVFSEILDETPRQPLLSLINSGVSPCNALLYGLLPQAFLNLLSYALYRFECSIRSAAVLGMIGAGGLGYQLYLSFQSTLNQYGQLWTLFYGLIILNGTVDLSSALLRRRLGCISRLDLNLHRLTTSSPQNYQRDPWIVGATGGILCLIPLCFAYVHPDITKLWAPRTLASLHQIGRATFPLDWQGIDWAQLTALSGQTLVMSIVAIAGAGIGGIILSFPAAHNFFLPGGLFNPHSREQGFIPAWLLLIFTRIFLLFCRAIPAPIWAFVVLFVIFPGILPGAIALGLHNLGILGRLMAEVSENMEKTPLQALKAQGTPAPSLFLYGVLPLTLPRFLAYILYRWEVCLRETVVVGLVGAGGLGRLLTEQLSSFDYGSVAVTLGCFMVLTFFVDWISHEARR